MSNKKLLILSPNFPPVNSADIHRVRHLSRYLHNYGFDIDVLTVNPKYSNTYSFDSLLSESISENTNIIYVNAFPVEITKYFGFTSLSIRSILQLFIKGSMLIRNNKYDLLFISTTSFHVFILGRIWKSIFNLPFVVDMQDPWRNDKLLHKPKSERPSKFLISYQIDKLLEKLTIPHASGILSVSQSYIDELTSRYNLLSSKIKMLTLPFAFDTNDFNIANKTNVDWIKFNQKKINVVYVGVLNHFFEKSIRVLFQSLKLIKIRKPDLYDKFNFWFIGTTYSDKKNQKTILSRLLLEYKVEDVVTEITQRVSYYEALNIMKNASVLLLITSDDSSYTPSKLQSYISLNKPIFPICYYKSNALNYLTSSGVNNIVTFDELIIDTSVNKCYELLLKFIDNEFTDLKYSNNVFTAKDMSENISELFKSIINHKYLY